MTSHPNVLPSPATDQSQRVPAQPPTRLEIERKLSFKSPAPSPTAADSPTRRPSRRPSGTLPASTVPIPGSAPATASALSTSIQNSNGNESDSSIASSSRGNPGAQSQSPITAPHAQLSAIEERELLDESEVDGEEFEDSEDEEAQKQEKGMEGERVLKSGYLSKKQERRKNWKKRWFVLRTNKLAYYKDDKEYLLCRIIDLQTIHTVAQVTVKKHPFAFGIVTPKRTFYAKAANHAEMEGWVKAINEAKKALAAADQPESTTSSGFQPGTYTSQASFSGFGTSPSVSIGPGSYHGQQPIPGSATSPTGTGGALPPLSASFAKLAVSTPGAASRRDPSGSSVSSQGDYFASSLQTPSGPGGSYAAGITSSDEDENDPGEFSDVMPSFASSSMPNSATISQPLQQRTIPIQTDPTKVILAAYLMKRSKGRRNWRKRWFVLTSGALVYTKSHMDTKVHRSIPLSYILDAIDIDSGEESEDDDPAGAGHHKTEHTFRVITPKRTFVLCAPTEEDEIKWLAALRALLNRERGASTAVGGQEQARGAGGQVLNVPLITQQPPSPAATTTLTGEESQPQTPSYARTRSATQSAKSAVADVVKRYHPEGSS